MPRAFLFHSFIHSSYVLGPPSALRLTRSRTPMPSRPRCFFQASKHVELLLTCSSCSPASQLSQMLKHCAAHPSSFAQRVRPTETVLPAKPCAFLAHPASSSTYRPHLRIPPSEPQHQVSSTAAIFLLSKCSTLESRSPSRNAIGYRQPLPSHVHFATLSPLLCPSDIRSVCGSIANSLTVPACPIALLPRSIPLYARWPHPDSSS